VLARAVVVLVLAVAVPFAVSQLLPPNDEPRSPVVPLLVLAALGALAGLTAPRLRAWIATALWVVVAAALVLASWTDLLLDVAPSVAPVDAWRNEAFLGIASAVAVTSAGFAAGALVRRRGSLGTVSRGAAIAVGGVLALCLVVAGGTAAAFSRTPIVVQDDAGLLTVVVTDAGLEVTPPAMGATRYRVVYESRATVPRVITRVVPLRVDDGLSRALTAGEIETWLAGDWASLGPPFASAAMSTLIRPGERRYAGLLGVDPSTDGTGGTLVYASGPNAFRPWPAMAGDGGYENVAWPIDAHVVLPVEGD
jgi:hypothetical protein